MRESVEQILAAYQALGLTPRRRGLQWEGPCPSCGGRNRWHVGPEPVMGCRSCGDFRAIAAALGLGHGPPGEVDTDAVERAETEKARRHADAARRAAVIYARCRPRRHQYLRAKGFHDARLPTHNGRIVVPVWGRRGLQSLQFIGRTRKRFLRGGRMAGGSAVIGPCDPRGRRWHVEGLATGLSVRRALLSLGVPDCVIICFSAAGLMVARDCRRALVVADHDASGTGQQAAERTGCPWWMPPEPGDANDFEQTHGTGALAGALRGLMVGGLRGAQWRAIVGNEQANAHYYLGVPRLSGSSRESRGIPQQAAGRSHRDDLLCRRGRHRADDVPAGGCQGPCGAEGGGVVSEALVPSPEVARLEGLTLQELEAEFGHAWQSFGRRTLVDAWYLGRSLGRVKDGLGRTFSRYCGRIGMSRSWAYRILNLADGYPSLEALTGQQTVDGAVRALPSRDAAEDAVPMPQHLFGEDRDAALRRWLIPLIVRQRAICGICGVVLSEYESDIHIDHKIPLARGGGNEVDNLHAVHRRCNLAKGVN